MSLWVFIKWRIASHIYPSMNVCEGVWSEGGGRYYFLWTFSNCDDILHEIKITLCHLCTLIREKNWAWTLFFFSLFLFFCHHIQINSHHIWWPNCEVKRCMKFSQCSIFPTIQRINDIIIMMEKDTKKKMTKNENKIKKKTVKRKTDCLMST